jgi:hypothetical protein
MIGCLKAKSLVEVKERKSSSKLWSKFLSKKLWPDICNFLAIETSSIVANWAQNMCLTGLFSNEDAHSFFSAVVRPFLVKDLEPVCKTGRIHLWIDLASTCGLSDQFSIVVKLNAEEKLKRWTPPSTLAIDLLRQWPEILANSSDFLARALTPRLASFVGDDLGCLLPFCDILPGESIANIIADSFLSTKGNEITKLAKKSVYEAVDLYVRVKEQIPQRFLTNPRIIEKLVMCLDRLKERNPILNNLKFNRESEASGISNVLEDVARDCHVEFSKSGTSEQKALFRLGDRVFGVSDGVVFLKECRNWIPVFIKEIPSILRKETARRSTV